MYVFDSLTSNSTSIYLLRIQNAKKLEYFSFRFCLYIIYFLPFLFWYFIIYLEHKIYCYISENINFPEFTSNLLTYVYPHTYIIIELFNHIQGSFAFFREKNWESSTQEVCIKGFITNASNL